MHETRRWSTSAVRRVRDGLVCGRIILGPWSDRFRIVNGVSSVFRACAVDRIPLWFAAVGSFPQCKWDCKWCWWMSCRWSFEGSLARNAFVRDSRCTKHCFSRQNVSPNVDDLPVRCDGCETVSCVVGSFSDHVRIILGPWSDRFRIVNGVSSVFRACAVDRIPLWFAAVGSFPQCKWDCKWCCMVDELPMKFWRKSRTKCVFFLHFGAIVIFLLKILSKSASKSSFFRSGVEIRFWSYNFRRRCA